MRPVGAAIQDPDSGGTRYTVRSADTSEQPCENFKGPITVAAVAEEEEEI